MSNVTQLIDGINQRQGWYSGTFRGAFTAAGIAPVDYRSTAGFRDSIVAAFGAVGAVDVSALAAATGVAVDPDPQITIDAAVAVILQAISRTNDALAELDGSPPETNIDSASAQLESATVPNLRSATNTLNGSIYTVTPAPAPILTDVGNAGSKVQTEGGTLQAAIVALVGSGPPGGSPLETNVAANTSAVATVQVDVVALNAVTGSAGAANVSAAVADNETVIQSAISTVNGALDSMSAEPADQVGYTILAPQSTAVAALANRLVAMGGSTPAAYAGIRTQLAAWAGNTSLTLAAYSAPYDPPPIATARLENAIAFVGNLVVVP